MSRSPSLWVAAGIAAVGGQVAWTWLALDDWSIGPGAALRSSSPCRCSWPAWSCCCSDPHHHVSTWARWDRRSSRRWSSRSPPWSTTWVRAGSTGSTRRRRPWCGSSGCCSSGRCSSWSAHVRTGRPSSGPALVTVVVVAGRAGARRRLAASAVALARRRRRDPARGGCAVGVGAAAWSPDPAVGRHPPLTGVLHRAGHGLRRP